LTFHGFNADYLQRLAQGDPFVEQHFCDYFGELLLARLRRRLHSPALIDDIRQETLLRVLRTLRSGAGVLEPDRFGAYVYSVCNNVMLELERDQQRHPLIKDNSADYADERVNLDLILVNEERKRLINQALREMSQRDGELLRLLFLEEMNPEDVCRRLGVDREYLRVLLHRAKHRFRSRFRALGPGGDGG